MAPSKWIAGWAGGLVAVVVALTWVVVQHHDSRADEDVAAHVVPGAAPHGGRGGAPSPSRDHPAPSPSTSAPPRPRAVQPTLGPADIDARLADALEEGGFEVFDGHPTSAITSDQAVEASHRFVTDRAGAASAFLVMATTHGQGRAVKGRGGTAHEQLFYDHQPVWLVVYRYRAPDYDNGPPGYTQPTPIVDQTAIVVVDPDTGKALSDTVG